MSNDTRRHHKTREEEADRSLNHTTFEPGTIGLIVALFLATVFIVPVIQHVVEVRENLAKRAAWKKESGTPEPGIAPRVYTIGSLLPTREQLSRANGFLDYWALIPTPEQITKFEDKLKEESVLTRNLLSPTQAFMTDVLGAGNEKAYVGRDGWLYYRPDVDYLTSSSFLDPGVLRARQHLANEIQPDPMRAIMATRDQLKERGIELVIVPVPTKPMVVPEGLIGSVPRAPLNNPAYQEFLARLSKAQIRYVDLTGIRSGTSDPLYLKTDTHWTPAGLDRAVEQIADVLGTDASLSALPKSEFSEVRTPVTHLGDIAEMLKLPKDQRIFSPETVEIGRVRNPDGTPWKPDPAAPILLLGDSFANIFSLAGMGWGESAGLAERLSYRLKLPLDKIVINAGGAFSARQELRARLLRGDDPLANKKVVVWEFCMRDLAQGDWKMLDLPKPKARAERPVAGEVMITARIAAKSQPPTPGSVPYKDCVIALHLTDLRAEGGKVNGEDILVYVWGMQNNQVSDGAYAVGGTVTLKLTPWSVAEAKFGGYNRIELDSDDALLWDAYWGEIKR